jgi:hypothetical protein
MRQITLRSFYCFLVFAALAEAQQQATTAAQLDFFRDVFVYVGSVERTTAEGQRREHAFVQQYRLTPSEAQLFSTTIEDFRVTLRQVRAATSQILASGARPLNEADRAQLDQLVAIRDSAVASLVTQFVGGLSAGTASRIRAAVQAVIATRK